MGSQDGDYDDDDDDDDDPLAFRTMKLGKPRKSINLTVKAARKTGRIYVANSVLWEVHQVRDKLNPR